MFKEIIYHWEKSVNLSANCKGNILNDLYLHCNKNEFQGGQLYYLTHIQHRFFS